MEPSPCRDSECQPRIQDIMEEDMYQLCRIQGRDAYQTLFGNLKGKDHLGDPHVDGWTDLKQFITVPDSAWEPFAMTYEHDNEPSNLKYVVEFHNQFHGYQLLKKDPSQRS
jgi:hypothetical protein